jgi:hypothetical protein
MANGTSYLSGTLGSPATSLGLGDQLSNQARDETEEERKRRLRMAGLADQQGSGSIFGRTGTASSIFGSTPALAGIFGSYGR